MIKKLSIIITYHNEPENIISPLLTSINNQVGIDFNDIEIIISNNCDEPHNNFDITKWNNLRDHSLIIYPDIKNKVGYSRKFASSIARGEWTIFCDCDDKLYCDYTIYNIFDLVKNNADMYFCKETCEEYNSQAKKITNITLFLMNYVFIHGKIFKTDILKKYEFNRIELSSHEDIYACMYLDGMDIKEEFSDLIIYSNKYNMNSVSRINSNEHTILRLPDLMRCYYFLFDDLSKVKEDMSEYNDYICRVITQQYYYSRSESLLSDKYELEGLTALFINRFDPNLNCLAYIPPKEYTEESYSDYIYRLINTLQNNIYPEWNYEVLFTQYYKKCDEKIKLYREKIRQSYDAYIKNDFDKSIEFAKQALVTNEFSYKSYILMALCYYKKKEMSKFNCFSSIAQDILENNLNDTLIENPCTMEEFNVYDELAMISYYNRDYQKAKYWGTFVEKKNYLNDERLKENLKFYNEELGD